MAKVIKGDRYYLAVVKQDTKIALAYAPNDEHLYYGDMVELENGMMGTCILVDDYVDGEDVIEHEKVSGMEAQRVICRYRRSEVEWNEKQENE